MRRADGEVSVERKGCVRIVEDMEHFLSRCTGMAEEREKLIRLRRIRWWNGVQHMEDRESDRSVGLCM